MEISNKLPQEKLLEDIFTMNNQTGIDVMRPIQEQEEKSEHISNETVPNNILGESGLNQIENVSTKQMDPIAAIKPAQEPRISRVLTSSMANARLFLSNVQVWTSNKYDSMQPILSFSLIRRRVEKDSIDYHSARNTLGQVHQKNDSLPEIMEQDSKTDTGSVRNTLISPIAKVPNANLDDFAEVNQHRDPLEAIHRDDNNFELTRETAETHDVSNKDKPQMITLRSLKNGFYSRKASSLSVNVGNQSGSIFRRIWELRRSNQVSPAVAISHENNNLQYEGKGKKLAVWRGEWISNQLAAGQRLVGSISMGQKTKKSKKKKRKGKKKNNKKKLNQDVDANDMKLAPDQREQVVNQQVPLDSEPFTAKDPQDNLSNDLADKQDEKSCENNMIASGDMIDNAAQSASQNNAEILSKASNPSNINQDNASGQANRSGRVAGMVSSFRNNVFDSSSYQFLSEFDMRNARRMLTSIRMRLSAIHRLSPSMGYLQFKFPMNFIGSNNHSNMPVPSIRAISSPLDDAEGTAIVAADRETPTQHMTPEAMNHETETPIDSHAVEPLTVVSQETQLPSSSSIELDELKKRMEDKVLEIELLQLSYKSIKVKHDTLQAQYSNLEMQSNQMNYSSQSQIQQLQQQLSQLYQLYQYSYQMLQDQYVQASNSLQLNSQNETQYLEKISLLESKLQEAENKLLSKESEIVSWDGLVQTKDKELSNLRSQIQEMELSIHECNHQSMIMKNQHEMVVENHEKQYQALQCDLSHIQSQRNDLEMKLKTSEDVIKSLETKNSSSLEAINHLTIQLAEVRNTIFSMEYQCQSTIQTKSNELQSLQQEIDTMRRSYETEYIMNNSRLNHLNEELNRKSNNEKNMQLQLEYLQAEKIGLEMQINYQGDMKEKENDWNMQMGELRKEIDEKEGLLLQLRDDYRDVTERKLDLEKNMNEVEMKYNKLLNDYNSIDSQYKEAIEKSHVSEQKIWALNNEKKDLQTSLQTCEIEKKGLKESYSALQSHNYTIDNELKSLQRMQTQTVQQYQQTVQSYETKFNIQEEYLRQFHEKLCAYQTSEGIMRSEIAKLKGESG